MQAQRQHQHRTKPPRAHQQRVETLRAWTAEVEASSRQHAAQNAPPPPPAPTPYIAHAPAVRVLGRIAIVAHGLAERAIAAFHRKLGLRSQAAPGARRAPDPAAALLRVIRALIRSDALTARLRQNLPLPDRTPPPTPTPQRPPAAPRGKLQRKRHNIGDLIADAQRRAAADIERLLKTRSVPEIVARICLDLRLDPTRPTWRRFAPLPPDPTPAPTPAQHQPPPAPTPPPVRPDPPTDPPD